MKKVLLSIVLLVSFMTESCSDKTSVNPQEEFFEKLEGEWVIESVTRDEQEITNYNNFAIEFARSSIKNVYTYATVNRPSLCPWDDEGVWVFGENFEQQMIREKGSDDEVIIEYAMVNNQLLLSFTYTGEGYSSRFASVGGEWVFTFSR